MKTFRILTWIFFGLSTTLHFYFPFLTLFLMDTGLTETQAPLVLSLSLFIATLSLPYIGELLDIGKYAWVIPIAFISTIVGLLGYLFRNNLAAYIYFITVVLFVFGTATTYSVARRITEGLSEPESRSKNASITYAVENAGLSMSALIAYLFLDKNESLMIFLDVITTSLLCGFLLYAHSLLKIQSTKKPSINFKSGFNYFFKYKTEFLCMLFVLVTTFAHFSGLQTYFVKLGVNAKEYAGILRFTNAIIVVVVSLCIARNIIVPKFNKHFILSSILISFGYLVLIVPINIYTLIFSTALWSIGESLIYPLVTERVLSRFDLNQSGIAVGTKDFVIRSSLIISPLLSALINLAGYKFTPYIFGVLPLMGGLMVITILLKKDVKHSS